MGKSTTFVLSKRVPFIFVRIWFIDCHTKFAHTFTKSNRFTGIHIQCTSRVCVSIRGVSKTNLTFIVLTSYVRKDKANLSPSPHNQQQHRISHP